MTGATGQTTTLAFWAKNLCMIRDAKMSWPGFSYTDPEWARFYALSAGVSSSDAQKFQVINAVIFIALAAVVMFVGFLPVASFLFPIPADTKASLFLSLLAVFALGTLGFGLPLSMRITAWLCASDALRARIAAAPEDIALAAKIRRQIWRMMAIMCGIMVPGALLFIAYNIEAGPLITVVKWGAILAIGWSTWTLRRRPTA